MARPKNVAKPVDASLLHQQDTTNEHASRNSPSSYAVQPGQRRSTRHQETSSNSSQQMQSSSGGMHYVPHMSVSQKQKQNCYDADDLKNPRVLLQAASRGEYD
jgi:hypothetical protein